MREFCHGVVRAGGTVVVLVARSFAVHFLSCFFFCSAFYCLVPGNIEGGLRGLIFSFYLVRNVEGVVRATVQGVQYWNEC